MMRNRLDVLAQWRTCQIKPAHKDDCGFVANKILAKRLRYDPIEKATGVPWYVVGALHYRESSFDFSTYLGNGDPLSKVTVHVPSGRGPFTGLNAWEDGAIDSLRLDGFSSLPPSGHWDIVTALISTEKFNGLGYMNRGLTSPYVWGLTNHQMPGEYIADGQFDPNRWAARPGCAALFFALRERGVDLNEK